MIKFFRRIRQRLLSENKFSKYLLYAIGEIVLVVIGILIALQINNANEVSKQKQKTNNYKTTLITELKADLTRLNELDTICRRKQVDINNYLSYFKKPDKEVRTVIQRMENVIYYGDFYQSIVFTIDDIINTGNLELFNKEIKHAILEFRATQEFYDKNRDEVVQKWVLSNLEFEKAVDMLSFNELPTDEFKNPKDWRFDLNSEQYRLFNNMALTALRTYYFRTDQNSKVRQGIENLLNVLEKD
ncbi:DUF6090 family protein [[Muricauda] lutisoli]|uniref:Uncharacterized protein n=1 Tax=[Muricauda] lutisoli TaxID=2816035 RepID=A0ABS3EV59_9FLAO|nr:DUF6090 family protein [[Muricauda] lutisoli]MBO0329831.1 hypothetical protein [[Muricauda] lutisoli]